jgi:hypothetical protein
MFARLFAAVLAIISRVRGGSWLPLARLPLFEMRQRPEIQADSANLCSHGHTFHRCSPALATSR